MHRSGQRPKPTVEGGRAVVDTPPTPKVYVGGKICDAAEIQTSTSPLNGSSAKQLDNDDDKIATV
jgi:hypothetical protein